MEISILKTQSVKNKIAIQTSTLKTRRFLVTLMNFKDFPEA